MLAIPNEYSKMLVSRWTPIPEMTANVMITAARKTDVLLVMVTR